MSQRCIGRLRTILAALIMLNGGEMAMSEEAREAASVSAWTPMSVARTSAAAADGARAMTRIPALAAT